MSYTAEQFRAAWVRAALVEWTMNVPASNADRITQYFAGIGWQWYLDERGVRGKYSELRRTQTGHLNYCGVGPAWVGVHLLGHYLEDRMSVNARLKPSVARICLPGTPRMVDPARWKAAGVEMPDRVPVDDVAANDLITVTTSGRRDEGDHFALVVKLGPSELHGVGAVGDEVLTLEWNANGMLGDRTQGRGVALRTRRRAMIRRVHRLHAGCFEAEE